MASKKISEGEPRSLFLVPNFNTSSETGVRFEHTCIFPLNSKAGRISHHYEHYTLLQGALGTLQQAGGISGLQGRGPVMDGKGEADALIIPPLILTHLPLGLRRDMEGKGGAGEVGKTLNLHPLRGEGEELKLMKKIA